ncbi:MAG TPA: hypothetical protein VJJ21_02275 [Candidatus Nanoarchaeia archaeon]|nr:hypothetical protein [Candidatus Nanoarchaeia archaeon]
MGVETRIYGELRIGGGGLDYKGIMRVMQDVCLNRLKTIFQEKGAECRAWRIYVPFLIIGEDDRALEAKKDNLICDVRARRTFGIEPFFCGYDVEFNVGGYSKNNLLHQAAREFLADVASFWKAEFDNGYKRDISFFSEEKIRTADFSSYPKIISSDSWLINPDL